MQNPMLRHLQQNQQASPTRQSAATPRTLSEALAYVNANGGNAREVFYKLAKERGVDPETILRTLR